MIGRIPRFFVMLCITGALISTSVVAAPRGEVDTVSVQAESDLDVVLAQISSDFTSSSQDAGKPVSVSNNFGNSAVQKKKIEDGESADLFITSQPDLIQQLKTKGMIDVYSVSILASRAGKSYSAAVVAGENMSAARVFLDFLKSETAATYFKKYGYSVP